MSEKREEVITMPMLHVRCIAPISETREFLTKWPILDWPEYVQVLPPVGSVMVNKDDTYRAYVETYSFGVDGLITIHLTLKQPER